MRMLRYGDGEINVELYNVTGDCIFKIVRAFMVVNLVRKRNLNQI